jgi:hypothetical protein
VGGALYAHRWHGDARRFVKRHAAELQRRPTWLFSSGPLDASATRAEIPPVPQVRQLMGRIGARGHTTFGGRLTADARGFVASSMARTHAGDWRDPGQIRAFARRIAVDVASQPARAAAPADVIWPGERSARRLVVALCLVAGVTATAGGLALALRPDGSLIKAPLDLLRHTPFQSFLVPGILLAGVVGLFNLLGGLWLARTRSQAAILVALTAGTLLTGWITVEMLLFRTVHWLQLFYLVVGMITTVKALQLRRRSQPDERAVIA